jgi:hypothetical protein
MYSQDSQQDISCVTFFMIFPLKGHCWQAFLALDGELSALSWHDTPYSAAGKEALRKTEKMCVLLILKRRGKRDVSQRERTEKSSVLLYHSRTGRKRHTALFRMGY